VLALDNNNYFPAHFGTRPLMRCDQTLNPDQLSIVLLLPSIRISFTRNELWRIKKTVGKKLLIQAKAASNDRYKNKTPIFLNTIDLEHIIVG